MDLRDYLWLVGRRWRVIVGMTLLGLAAAVGITALMTPVYQARTRMFVSVRERGDIALAIQGNQFSQERVKSYSQIIAAPVVTGPVIARLHLPLTPAELAAKITTSVPADTVLIDVAVRDRSAATARSIADALDRQFIEALARIEASSAASSPVAVTVVRPPDTSGGRVSPKPPFNLGLGAALGLVLGLAAAVAWEAFDTRLRGLEDIQQVCAAAPLGIIGYDPAARSWPMTALSAGRSVRGEAFRTLRTNLRFVDVDRPPRTIVVTSAVPAEGKTTTACSLAVALAEAGMRVALVEGDLRRPSIATAMGVEGAAGLTDVLTGRAELSDVLQPWGSSDVSILAGGPLPPNPSELLSSTQMTSLLSQLRDRFDFVILDSPPLLPVTDAALLARISDGALVVVRYGRTRREHLERCLHSLTSIGARVLGSVVNMAPVRSGSAYGYGYGYERRAPVPVSVPDQGAGDPARPEASTAPPSR